MGNPEESQPAITGANLELELKLANDEWATAIARRDRDALDKIMADEFVLAYPFEGDDKEQFISDILAGELKVESLQAHDSTIRVAGETGLIFGNETANWHYRDRDLSGAYRFLRVYTRREGKWRIMALHLCAPHHK